MDITRLIDTIVSLYDDGLITCYDDIIEVIEEMANDEA